MMPQEQGKGLLSQQQEPQQPQQQPAQQQGMSREQMADLEGLVQLGRNIVYEGEIFDAIVERATQDKVGALAEAAVSVIAKMEESGRNIEPANALGIGLALIADIADALMQAGMPEYTQEELMAAVQGAVTLYLETNKDRVDPQQMQAQVQELQGVMGGMI